MLSGLRRSFQKSSRLSREAGHFMIDFASCSETSGFPIFGPCPDMGTRPEKNFKNLRIPFRESFDEGRSTLFIPGLDVGATEQQPRGCLIMAIFSSMRGQYLLVGTPSTLQKHLQNHVVATPRRKAVLISDRGLPGKKSDTISLASVRRVTETRPTVLVLGVLINTVGRKWKQKLWRTARGSHHQGGSAGFVRD